MMYVKLDTEVTQNGSVQTKIHKCITTKMLYNLFSYWSYTTLDSNTLRNSKKSSVLLEYEALMKRSNEVYFFMCMSVKSTIMKMFMTSI